MIEIRIFFVAHCRSLGARALRVLHLCSLRNLGLLCRAGHAPATSQEPHLAGRLHQHLAELDPSLLGHLLPSGILPRRPLIFAREVWCCSPPAIVGRYSWRCYLCHCTLEMGQSQATSLVRIHPVHHRNGPLFSPRARFVRCGVGDFPIRCCHGSWYRVQHTPAVFSGFNRRS